MSIEVQSGLHWWTACTSSPESSVIREFGGDQAFGKLEVRGGFGHPYRRVHESGMEVFSGSRRDGQPVVMNASGLVCETWSKELIKNTLALGGYCTRMDLAVDVFPADQARKRLLQLRRDFRAGRCKTSMRSDSAEFHHSDGETGGATVYFGGKSSDARLRVYDVRGPIRLEWQLRPAGKEAGAVAVHNVSHFGVLPVWRWASQTKLMFNAPWFVDVASGSIVELPVDDRASSTMEEAIEQIKKQYGASISAMIALGVDLTKLAKFIDSDELKSPVRAKFQRWASEGDSVGLNGDKLRSMLTRQNED